MFEFAHPVLQRIHSFPFPLFPYFSRLLPYCPLTSLPLGFASPTSENHPGVTSTSQPKTLTMAKVKCPFPRRMRNQDNPFLRT